MEFNLDEYFCPVPGSEKEKDIVIFARRHWISFLGDIIVSVMLLLLPIVILVAAHYLSPHSFQGRFLNFLVVAGSAYYLMIITSIFNAWISYYYDIYILTSDLIADITQKGFFNRKISQLSLLRVQDVSSKIEGFFPTMFAYGDVLIETAGESAETFLLKSVPNPQAFSAKVLELHDQLIEREGRHNQILEGEGALQRPIMPESAPAPDPDPTPTPTQSPNPISFNNNTSQTEENLSTLDTRYCKPRESNEGEIKKDDLNQGGEVKL